MFGMSFEKNTPQNSPRLEAADNQELIDSLMESGFISSAQSLSAEDYVAVKSRTEILEKKSHINTDVAIALAYIDRKAAFEKSVGNSELGVLSKVTTDLVSTLVTADLASNDEFLQTVLNAALLTYKNGSYLAFSDALIEAADKRQKEILSTPEISGKIDGNSNVILPSDE